MSRSLFNSRRTVWIATLLFCSVPFCFGGPRLGQKPKDTVASLEQQWRTATLAADTSTIDKLLSDDYVGISWTGQVSTKTMQLDRLRNHALVLSKLDISDMKVKVVGSIAIVTCTAELDGVNEGNVMHGQFRYTRVWQRLPAGIWKITNFEATRIPSAEDRMNRRQKPLTP